MTNYDAAIKAAEGRACAARRYLAAGSAAALCVLWLFGVCGFALPHGIDPRTNPSGHAAAQLLLFLPILPPVMRILQSGGRTLARGRTDAAAALLVSAAASLADSLILTVRVALAVGGGALALAGRIATELPLALTGSTLVCVSFAARHGCLPPSRITARACRVILPCEAVAAILVCGAVWLHFGDASTALHAALLVLAVSTPASLVLAAPLFAAAAKKHLPAKICDADFECLGAISVLLFADDALHEDAPTLNDMYTVTGNKPALLATAAALAAGAADAHAAALGDAAASLGLRLPRTACAWRSRTGFGGTVHHRTWRFQTEDAAAPELIRRTDFGGEEALYAFADGRFRGVLLFAKAASADADAALACLAAVGVDVSVRPAEQHGDAFLPPTREKVLHVTRDGATIKLADAEGRVICRTETLSEAVAAVLCGRRAAASVRTAVAVSGAAVLFCLAAIGGVCIGAGGAALACAAAVRLSATVTVLLLALAPGRTAPPEIQFEKERPAMFGKVNYTVRVEGMSCSHCAAHVKTALESIRGVSADVVLDEKVARVKCPAALDEKKLADAVTDAGFTVVSVERV